MKSYFLCCLFLLTYSHDIMAHISTDGDEFKATYNKHGAVLTSVFVKHRFVGFGAGGEIESKKVKIYLGKSCDASSDFYGKGTWEWETRGFVVHFSGKDLGFMGEIDVDDEGKCRTPASLD